MFLKHSTGQIPPKKRRGKGSQGKKTADIPMADVDVFEESDSEPARKRTASRRMVKKKVTISAADNIIPDPDVALELGKYISLTEAAKEEAARQVHATHARIMIESIPKPARRRPSGVPDESNVVSATSSEGTKSKYPEEDQGDDEEVDWIDFNEDDKKKDDTDDDKSIDLEMIDDEETKDEFVQGDEQVNDDEDEKMTNAEVEESGNGVAEISDAAKADVEKIEEVKDDAKKTELPLTSSSLSISSGFGNQFLKLSSDTSLMSTVNHTTNAKINSLLDIKIQFEVPHIQSPSVLTVPVSMISEPSVLTPLQETPLIATVTSLHPPYVSNIPHKSELKKIDHSAEALATLKSQVPTVVEHYLGSKIGYDLQKELGDRMERAATTASSLEAEQDSGSGPRCQDTILGDVDAQTRFETISKQSNDPPLSRGYTLGSREDGMKLLELMELCAKLSKMLHKNRKSVLAKANTVNGECQLQALIHKKKVIIIESSIRSDLHLEDAGGTDCLPTTTIFKELARMGAKSTAWNEFSSKMASLIICLATNQKFNMSKYIFDAMLGDMSHHKKIYVNPSYTKKIFANMKKEGNDFSGRITPLFETMMVQPTQDEGLDSGIPTDSHQTPITTQPSSSRSQKKQSRRKQRKDTIVTQEEIQQDDSVPTPSNDPPLSEKAKDTQAKEIADLKKRVQKLERKKKSRTTGLKRLKKVGMSRRVESSEDKDSLGDHEAASKQGRSIEDIDKDADVSLVDDTQGRSDNEEMFDINYLHSDEVNMDMPVGKKLEQSAKEREIDTSVEDSTAPTTIKEITLAQTLIQIKAAKPKVVTTAATTTTTTRPKARGVVVHGPSEFKTLQESQPLMIKDKGKAIMIEPEVPLKRKDQVALDEDLARNLQAQLEAKLIEEERLARKQEEEANIALIESWDNIQAMMEAYFELAQRLQTEEQGEITIEERSRLFVELMNKRKKHFAMLRAGEKRRKPPTKTQKRNLMSTYLKNMGGYKHNQLKSKSYEEIQKMFNNEIRRDELDSDKSKKAESSEEKAKGSRKKILETDEHEEVNEAELKKHLVIVKDDDIAIDAIPLATKPPDIDREDLETLWKLVKTKHGDIRPKDEHERVLWGNFKVMFEPDIKSDVWRNLQGYKVTIWKLYDSCRVHFVRFENVHIFMLVEKRYPLTPITITNMLNKKLQTDYWNEMCYQLIKLMRMNIKFRGGLLGLKRLQGFLEVTTAQKSFKPRSIQGYLKAKDQDIMFTDKDIKIKIKIQYHKHAKETSKEFPRLQGSKTKDVTRSEAICAMTAP
ncbi:hypothetical protein Tco_1106646 [Tanacetum coccineum]